ncbi:contactin-5-like [Actinia tenebrosa]|uniref:Contactin-5-like n=1 Tax=Actinia tenebrosa TaxID=6105 RepID=A0A6P8JBA8_ACTTE|nr:contactin-5-like [Actinia tenebrosa]
MEFFLKDVTRFMSVGCQDVTSYDGGIYSCEARSALGVAQANVTLIVQVPPRIVHITSSQIVEEGANVTLRCLTSHWSTVSWSKPYGKIPKSQSTKKEAKLIISGIKMEDSGDYVCQAENILGKNTKVTQITVVGALRFEVKPVLTNFPTIGSRVVINCKVVGALVTQWKKGNESLSEFISIFPNGTLVIPKLRNTDLGVYILTARNFQRAITAQVQIGYASCSEIKKTIPLLLSGKYTISPGGLSSFSVYCDMTDKGGVGVTVVSHDSEARTLVNGFEGVGSYRRDIHYAGITMNQVAALTKASRSCEQFLSFECQGDVAFIADGYGWWMSRDNVRQNYWGGATPGSGKCACGMTNSCQRRPGYCNCNNVGSHSEWHSDSGLLTDKSTLPVTQLRFGDTGDSSEKGYHTLGRLKCYGTL